MVTQGKEWGLLDGLAPSGCTLIAVADLYLPSEPEYFGVAHHRFLWIALALPGPAGHIPGDLVHDLRQSAGRITRVKYLR